MSLKLYCAYDEAGSAAIMRTINPSATAVVLKFLSRLVTAFLLQISALNQPAKSAWRRRGQGWRNRGRHYRTYWARRRRYASDGPRRFVEQHSTRTQSTRAGHTDGARQRRVYFAWHGGLVS